MNSIFKQLISIEWQFKLKRFSQCDGVFKWQMKTKKKYQSCWYNKIYWIFKIGNLIHRWIIFSFNLLHNIQYIRLNGITFCTIRSMEKVCIHVSVFLLKQLGKHYKNSCPKKWQCKNWWYALKIRVGRVSTNTYLIFWPYL